MCILSPINMFPVIVYTFPLHKAHITRVCNHLTFMRCLGDCMHELSSKHSVVFHYRSSCAKLTTGISTFLPSEGSLGVRGGVLKGHSVREFMHRFSGNWPSTTVNFIIVPENA